jgi:hypothetical protein
MAECVRRVKEIIGRLIYRKLPACRALLRDGNRLEELRFHEPKQGGICASTLILIDFRRKKSD